MVHVVSIWICVCIHSVTEDTISIQFDVNRFEHTFPNSQIETQFWMSDIEITKKRDIFSMLINFITANKRNEKKIKSGKHFKCKSIPKLQ